MPEIYWEYDMSPRNLRRRADDLDRDGLNALAQMLRQRAKKFEEQGYAP